MPDFPSCRSSPRLVAKLVPRAADRHPRPAPADAPGEVRQLVLPGDRRDWSSAVRHGGDLRVLGVWTDSATIWAAIWVLHHERPPEAERILRRPGLDASSTQAANDVTADRTDRLPQDVARPGPLHRRRGPDLRVDPTRPQGLCGDGRQERRLARLAPPPPDDPADGLWRGRRLPDRLGAAGPAPPENPDPAIALWATYTRAVMAPGDPQAQGRSLEQSAPGRSARSGRSPRSSMPPRRPRAPPGSVSWTRRHCLAPDHDHPESAKKLWAGMGRARGEAQIQEVARLRGDQHQAGLIGWP